MNKKSKIPSIFLVIAKTNLYKKDKITLELLHFLMNLSQLLNCFLLGVSIFIVHEKIKITPYKSLLTNFLKNIKSPSKLGQMKFSSKNKSVILLSQ